VSYTQPPTWRDTTTGMAELDRPTEDEGADRRTSLATERTVLAWWRTGFTAIAVALGVGRVLPDLATHPTRWPYVVIGVGFALYGIALILYGTWSLRDQMGEPMTASRPLLALAGAGVLLGFASVLLIVIS
jgi:putative membrane protein